MRVSKANLPSASRVLLVVCALGAAQCGQTGNDLQLESPRHSAPSAAAKNEKEAPKAKHMPELLSGDALAGTRAATFSPLVPSKFEGFKAKAEPEGKDIDLGEGAGLSVLKRAYYKGGTALEIEVVDTMEAKPLRTLFDKTREVELHNESAVVKPVKVQGQKAYAQWNSTGRASRVTVLVDNRFLVNLSLRPTDSITAGLDLAEKLEFSELQKLSANDELAKH